MKKNLLVNPMDWVNKTLNDEDLSLDDLLYDLSVAIIDYRIKNNLDQKSLAAKLNVSQAMVSKYESCEYNFSVEKLDDIAKKLDLKLSISLQPKECNGKEAVKSHWSKSHNSNSKGSEHIA
jgi:ribosome-binding protein aMBF1 (putative translation factor)